MDLGDDAEGGWNGAPADRAAPSADGAPLLVLVASREGRGVSWVTEVTAAGARGVLVTDCGVLGRLLANPTVDAIVICADDPAQCHERVTAARQQIGLAPRRVPLIVWRLEPHSEGRARSALYELGADSVLDAPSPVSELLSCALTSRELLHTPHGQR